jgi:hypothetical protein
VPLVAERGRRRLAALALVALAAGPAAACTSSAASRTATTFVRLDGSPRVPDAEGVLVDVAGDFATITLDGKRTYKVSKALQSFSTIDGSILPLAGRIGEYVQVGLEGKTAVWIASVADIIDDGEQQLVYYTGSIAAHDGDQLTFKDGTVLTLGSGVDVPDGAEHVVVTIAPKEHVVTSVTHG